MTEPGTTNGGMGRRSAPIHADLGKNLRESASKTPLDSAPGLQYIRINQRLDNSQKQYYSTSDIDY